MIKYVQRNYEASGGISITAGVTPIYDFLKKYAGSEPAVFHMPGHRLGRGFPPGFSENLAALDITEIPGADNLHWPDGVIMESQRLAAAAFGADYTCFSVNGSTGALHAMIMAACKKGDTLIVGRDCHRAAINAMLLAGVEPVYLFPELDEGFGISTVITPQSVKKALEDYPEAAGVLITRPGYYGACSDIRSIAELVHRRGKVLVVDEAHGAHLRFSPRLPVCALEAGADACVQSAHKTLPALTQGAYLHVKGSGLDRERLMFFLDMLQTTSPSYLIMASLDVARSLMELYGGPLLSSLLELLSEFREEIRGASGYELLQAVKNGTADPTRLVIKVAGRGLTGYDAMELLGKNHNIQVEMADLNNIVCITTVCSLREDFSRLAEALRLLPESGNRPFKAPPIISPPRCGERALSLKETLEARGRRLDISSAAGRISKAMLTPYPPGIPVVFPGERITPQTAEYIRCIVEIGGDVGGLSENFEVYVVE